MTEIRSLKSPAYFVLMFIAEGQLLRHFLHSPDTNCRSNIVGGCCVCVWRLSLLICLLKLNGHFSTQMWLVHISVVQMCGEYLYGWIFSCLLTLITFICVVNQMFTTTYRVRAIKYYRAIIIIIIINKETNHYCIVCYLRFCSNKLIV